MTDLLEKSPYAEDRGELIGVDPRRISRERREVAAAGLGWNVSPLRSIRAKCLDCCAGNAAEVRKCVMLDCALWPHRMGVNTLSTRLRERNPGTE